MNNKIAIDFGTSRTKAAYYNTNKENAELVELGRGGRKAIPSLFHYDEKGEISIGEEAQEWRQAEPLAIIARLKLQLQKKFKPRVSGKRILPEALLAHLFTKIREIVEKDPSIFSGQSSPLSVVLTTTLHFQFHEREVLKSAAEKAGFEPPVEFLPEPEAAVRAWAASSAKESTDKSTEVVVLDCGGGTLDWAYLHEGRDGKFHLNPSLHPGASDIGGEDVDEALLKLHVLPRLPPKDAEEQMVRLREEVRARKELYCTTGKELSLRVGPNPPITLEGSDIQTVINEVFITPLCNTIEPFLRNVASVTGRGIPPLLLVGGSSSLKGLKERLEERFDCEVFSCNQAEFATVLGAAVPLPPEQEPDATYERAVAYVNADKFEEAIVEFQAVLKIAPHHADSHAGIAAAHLGLGNLKKAADAAKIAIASEPNHELARKTQDGIIWVSRKQGATHMEVRNYETALSKFDVALYVNPHHAEALMDSARAYLNLGKIEKADAIVRRVLNRNPVLPPAQQALVDIAEAYLAQGKIEKAKEAVQEVLSSNPNFRPARRVLERIVLAKTEAAEKDEEEGYPERFFLVAVCLGLALGLVDFIFFGWVLSQPDLSGWNQNAFVAVFVAAFVVLIWAGFFYSGLWHLIRSGSTEGGGWPVFWFAKTIAFFWWVWCRISGKREE